MLPMNETEKLQNKLTSEESNSTGFQELILKIEGKSVATENSSTIIYLILSYLFSVLIFTVTFHATLVSDLNSDRINQNIVLSQSSLGFDP